jgi:6-phosphogluconolactonase (cycloisomerase 2 family)
MTPTVAAGLNANNVAVDPSGRYAYVTVSGTASIAQYTIAADGSLTPMTPATVVAGTFPISVAVHPSGRYVYVANLGSGAVPGNISQYTIGADGGLAAMATATVDAGARPISVAVDPSGQYVYVANFDSDDVSQYTVGADGSLTAMAPPTVAAGTNPRTITTVGTSQ